MSIPTVGSVVGALDPYTRSWNKWISPRKTRQRVSVLRDNRGPRSPLHHSPLERGIGVDSSRAGALLPARFPASRHQSSARDKGECRQAKCQIQRSPTLRRVMSPYKWSGSICHNSPERYGRRLGYIIGRTLFHAQDRLRRVRSK